MNQLSGIGIFIVFVSEVNREYLGLQKKKFSWELQFEEFFKVISFKIPMDENSQIYIYIKG